MSGRYTADAMLRRAFCTRCRKKLRRSPGQRWCQSCDAEWHRKRRTSYAMLSLEEKNKQRARSIARSAVRRGKLERGPCCVCGSGRNVELHHIRYDRPLDVVSLCRACHRRAHGERSS